MCVIFVLYTCCVAALFAAHVFCAYFLRCVMLQLLRCLSVKSGFIMYALVARCCNALLMCILLKQTNVTPCKSALLRLVRGGGYIFLQTV